MSLPFLQRFDEVLTARFPLPVGKCPADSEDGAWFLPPSQHLLEGSIFIVLCLVTLVVSGRKFHRQLRAEEREAVAAGVAVRKPDPPTKLVRFFDVLFTSILFISACTVVYHKWHGINKLPYLLQPCHLLHAFLLYILTLPRGSSQGAVLLSIFLHELSAPFLGTVAVDLSCYKQRFEALNWGVQHGMLLLVPLHLLATRRFGNRVHGGPALFCFSFAAMTLLHYLVLVPASVVTGTNLNYVLCAPPSLAALPIALGTHYRTPMIFFCGLLAWLLRYTVVDAFLKYVVDRDRHTRKLAKIEPAAEDEQTTSSSSSNGKSAKEDGLRKRN